MKYLLYILWKFKSIITLVVLLSASVVLMIRYDDFKHAEYFHISNSVNGSIRQTMSDMQYLYNLTDENRKLQLQNARLLDTIAFYKTMYIATDTTKVIDFLLKKNRFVNAMVVSNFPSNPKNLIVLNKGRLDSIRKSMGVLSSDGVVGEVVAVSDHNALVMPITHVDSRISGKHKNSAQTCSVYWQGAANNTLQITDIPIHTNIKIGDTILTSGYSAIYPRDIPIGVVSKIEKETSFYTLEVKTMADFGKLYTVHVFDNKEQTDVHELIRNLKK